MQVLGGWTTGVLRTEGWRTRSLFIAIIEPTYKTSVSSVIPVRSIPVRSIPACKLLSYPAPSPLTAI